MATNDAAFDVLLPSVSGLGTHRGAIGNLTVPIVELNVAVGATLNIEVPLPEIGGSITAPIMGDASIVVPLVSITTTTGGVASVTPPLVEVVGTGTAGTIASANITVPAPEIGAEGSVPLHANASINVPLLIVNATGSRQNTVNADINVPRIDIDASGFAGTVASGSVNVPVAQVSSSAYFTPHGTATLTVPLVVAEGYGTETGIPAVGNAAITVPLVIVEGSTGEIIASTNFVYFDPATIAVNLNLSCMMVSEYYNYKFNSQTYFNGKYLGANTDGLFDLSGDNDAGTDIAAKIRTGLDDVGSFNLKRVWAVYLSHNGEALRIKTAAPADDYGTVGGAKNRAAISVQKFKVQRTKRDNYWGVQVENVGGSDFEINGLEMICEVLNRRAL